MAAKTDKAKKTDEISDGLRRYLYLTAATTGACILIVEILGARMLSPFLGTSHFVWTAQISVTLVSLAVGYYFGGWMVDKAADLKRIYACIMGAAVYLALTLGMTEAVALSCLRFKLSVGSILASMFLFFVPLTLLAAVGPFFIRVLTLDLSKVGGQVGRLSAVSTFGSVFGAVLIGYVLIPLMPNSVTMWVTSLVLLVLGGSYFAIWGLKAGKVKAAGVSVVALLIGGLAARADLTMDSKDFDELDRRNSNFGDLRVWKAKDSGYLYYLNDRLTQNIYDPATEQSTTLFTYMLHGLSKVYVPQNEKTLCIGLGVGIVPMDLVDEGVEVDVVEINPEVVDVGKQYFGLEPDRMNIVIDDGRHFVNESNEQYDCVILDAFLGDASPSHLMSKEAFQGIAKVMSNEAVLVINSFGNFEPGQDFFTSSLDQTLQSVFSSVRIHHSGNGNVFFVASKRETLEFVRQPDMSNIHPQVQGVVQRAYEGTTVTNPESGIVLTDDFNPTEFRDAENREAIRKGLVSYLR